MSHDITIRVATPQDQAVLEEMLFQSLFVPPGEPPFTRDILQNPNIARYVREWGRAGDFAFVATDTATGQGVGASRLRLLKAEEMGYGYLDDETPELGVALLPEYRGQGIGTRLLE